mgnify:CR=1 FL=1
MFKDKKVLVTGGTGLVGRELVELMVKRGADVTSVSLDENNLDPAWGATYIITVMKFAKAWIMSSISQVLKDRQLL